MSTKVPQNNTDQEIDLAQISKKISAFLDRINSFIFRGIQFFVKNWIIVLILIIAGFALGIFLDKTQKKYQHQIIVAPNFGSTDYLYSKIDLITSKINENDTTFLKTLGIKKPSNLKSIEIKPIADVYNFINNKPENFELIKLMAEDGDIKKVLQENITSKNYTYQTIVLDTKNKISEDELVKPLLKYFNTSDHFSKIQKEMYRNVQLKMKQNDTIIKQIDGVLNNFSKSTNSNAKSDKLVYYNENTQLNDIIKTKDVLINEQAYHKIELIGFDKIIKENSIVLNKEFITFGGNLKLILPIIFILGFILVKIFVDFYRKQSRILTV
ncbi:hypothetical protein IRZ71_03105 [Flavobacterium sp. ANB]|uniref:hypothetical protein n=1 Tax=unclassified Flavobacterium TaxID=196869 RepID=UPI0012BA1D6D|nr:MULTISPECIES: hypothetical protein [unclassified Flavobacterium]MBF4515310.1 hypothetical protein [Flavobacterium sp. ANB]MTD70222.1 hypothetical protein [Flavobacterium sp. LC2016-13]